MNGFHDIIYSVESYSELSLILSSVGFSVPSKAIFDMCHPDDWKWEVLCWVMEDIATEEMTAEELNSAIENALII